MLGSEVFTSYAILDHTMTVRYKSSSLSYYYLNSIVDELLEECGDLCEIEPCSGTIDSDGDGIDDECDDCLNMSGDVNDDFIVDVFGELKGRHARSAIGVAGLPMNFAIEIEAELEIS